MTRAGLVFWTVFAVTLAVYAAMLVWTLPAISRDAGGLAAFDMRPGGYDLTQAQAFLSALGERGRALYLGPQRWLDTAYPPLLALTLSIAYFRLLPPARVRLAIPTVALAWAGASFDLLENIRVRALLRAGADGLDAAMVGAASFATVMKSLFDTFAFLALLALFLPWLWRRWRARATKGGPT